MVPSTLTDDGCRSAWPAIGIVLKFSRNPGPPTRLERQDFDHSKL